MEQLPVAVSLNLYVQLLGSTSSIGEGKRIKTKGVWQYLNTRFQESNLNWLGHTASLSTRFVVNTIAQNEQQAHYPQKEGTDHICHKQ